MNSEISNTTVTARVNGKNSPACVDVQIHSSALATEIAGRFVEQGAHSGANQDYATLKFNIGHPNHLREPPKYPFSGEVVHFVSIPQARELRAVLDGILSQADAE